MQQPDKQTDLSLLEEMGYEPQDVDVKHMPMHAVGLFVSIIVVLALAWLIMLVINPESVGRKEPDPFRVMPESPDPLLQTNTTAHLDMIQLREHENEVIHGYGWTDADTGKAHVPIDRAMDMVLEEGLPSRGGAPVMTPEEPIAPAETDSGHGEGAVDDHSEPPVEGGTEEHTEPPHEEAGH